MKRSRLEIARAVLRLSTEPLVPVERFRERTTADTHSVIRWITRGRGGVFLDGLHRPGVGWMSSFAALERFFAQTRATPEQASKQGEPDAPVRLRPDDAA